MKSDNVKQQPRLWTDFGEFEVLQAVEEVLAQPREAIQNLVEDLADSPSLVRTQMQDLEKQGALCLLGYHHVIRTGSDFGDSVDKIEVLLEAGRKSDRNGRAVRQYLTYLQHVGSLAALQPGEETSKEDAWIFLDREVPDGIQQVEVCVPLVPTKSPFTICIASAIRTLMVTCNHKRDTRLVVGWNAPSYGKTKEVLRPHLGFDTDWSHERLESFFTLHEQAFLSFLARMAAGTESEAPLSEEITWKLLDGLVEPTSFSITPYGREEAYWRGALEANQELYWFILGELRGFTSQLGWDTNNILYYFAQIARDRLLKRTDQAVVLLAPFPLAICLEHAFSALDEAAATDAAMEKEQQELADMRNRLVFAAYMPFPSNLVVRQILPFYLSEFSHLVYSEASDRKTNCSQAKRAILRLVLSAFKQLEYAGNWAEPLRIGNYEELLRRISKIFMEEDRRQREYLRYV